MTDAEFEEKVLDILRRRLNVGVVVHKEDDRNAIKLEVELYHDRPGPLYPGRELICRDLEVFEV